MVERPELKLATASARELIARLSELRGTAERVALAFDADGTLWSGDVSEDVFQHAVTNGFLREEPARALGQAARQFGVDDSGSAAAIARRIFAEYRNGRYPEREVCEMMTWCYAGYTKADVARYASSVLQGADLGSRLNRGLEPVFEWARTEAVRTIVVSASPRPIVEVAAALWHFPASDIAASDPEYDGERIAPRMNGQVPYEKHKCQAARRLLEGYDWLASFGDNLYDIDMMREARLGVAVEPKPALRKLLPGLPFIVLLAG